MDRLVQHLFVFEGNGIIQDFPGNYSQYRMQQKEEGKKLAEKNETAAKNILATPAANATIAKRKATYNEKKNLKCCRQKYHSSRKKSKHLPSS